MAASIKCKPLWLGLALLGVLVVAATLGLYQLGVGQESDEPQGGPIAMPSTQGDFSLTQLGDDEIAIISFGYTYCPDVCPMNQAVKRQALAQLNDAQRERVVPVMITVDPERDTLARMSEYMQFFGEEFIGLVGNQAQLTDVAERYGVIWRRVEAPESGQAAARYLGRLGGDRKNQDSGCVIAFKAPPGTPLF